MDHDGQVSSTPPPKIIWAKLSGHPFWPARSCRDDETEKHIRFRQRKTDVLVHFFAAEGSAGSYGWVSPLILKDFDPLQVEEHLKVKNKSLRAAILVAVEFCARLAEGAGYECFLPPVVVDEGTCAVCGKNADAGTIIICDKCDDEFHLNCLEPPPESIPSGDWFCRGCDPASFGPHRKRSSPVSGDVGVAPQDQERPKKKRGRPQAPAKALAPAYESDDSEDFCMVCGCEGKLLVCDFAGCRKVFHSVCIWPSSDGAEASDQPWFCPRHHCATCSFKEGERSEESSQNTSTVKCATCVLSFCAKCAPGQAAKCSFCASPSPRVELALAFFEAWSKMANHYLALPFLRPLLSLPAATPSQGDPEDLLGVLERVRSLHYISRAVFVSDLEGIRKRCQAADSTIAPTLVEAMSTLMLSAEQVLARHAFKLEGLERALRAEVKQALSAGAASGQPTPGDFMVAAGKTLGLCGHVPGSRLPNATPYKSLTDWEAYVLDPPPEDSSDIEIHSTESSRTPHLGSVASMLLSLASSVPSPPSGHHVPANDNTDLDPFQGLAPDDITHMFDGQAAMLRRLVSSNAKLRDEWRRSKEKLLLGPAGGEENAITLGEAHVLVELQVANQALSAHVDSLKTQLESKARELQASQIECAKYRAASLPSCGTEEAKVPRKPTNS